MGLKLLDHGSAEYKQMVQLRFQILRQPLGLTFTQEELEVEKDDILIGKVIIAKKTKSLVFVKADLFQSENIIASASGIWKILK
jgi:hypothetical protein